MPPPKLCSSREQAMAAFRDLQKPLAVKIAAPDVAHKTEAGGVHLNIRTEAQFADRLDKLARIPTEYPGQTLVEEMAPEGVELIVGGIRDASWGPCVVLGLGGMLAEALADTVIRLAPVSEVDVSDMLESLEAASSSAVSATSLYAIEPLSPKQSWQLADCYWSIQK